MQSPIERISLQTPDISCGHCVNAIETRLGAIDGIAKVQASAEAKSVDVEFDSTRLTLDTIEAELADEGYPVAK